jgi:type IV pilus assembly protein PilB
MEAAIEFARERVRLGTLLLQRELVTAEQLAEALEEKEETGRRLGEIVLAHGWVSEVALARALADQLHIDFVDIGASPPNPAVANLLPDRYARRYRAIPVRFIGENTVLVAVEDPTNVVASDDLRLVLGIEIQLAVATASDIEGGLERFYPVSDAEVEAVDGEDAESLPSAGPRADIVDVRSGGVASAPAVTLVNEMIKRAIEEGASDVHFEPQYERLIVRARIDGVMQQLKVVSADLQQAVTTRLKIMGDLDIAERRAPQDGRVSIRFGGEPMDLRIAVLPTVYGEQVVLRILYRTATAIDFSQLGLADDAAETLRWAIGQPYGAIFASGPTGSGKTTTLYAALGMLNDPERVVMTIEDPVEYQLDGVNQIQINPKAGLTFAQGLRTILRSDPDVLLVGEIRDNETAKIAIQAAMTGHLVLSTLHADNAANSISRLRDMGVDTSLLAGTVNCIFSQRLVRKLCPSCKKPYTPVADTLRRAGFSEDIALSGNVTLYRPRGCVQCMGGYKGRVALYEVLKVTAEMRRLIEAASSEEIYAAAVAAGMRTLYEDGLRHSLAGVTSLEEVRRVAGERRV